MPAFQINHNAHPQQSLELETISPAERKTVPTVGNRRAIEGDEFPFDAISHIAEAESWRKEVYRPLSHIHKWWAQRLGSVFRALIIGAFLKEGEDVLGAFYRPLKIPEATIFDPFMGSGTTLLEAAKLEAKAIGRDINPVSHFAVQTALSIHDREAVVKEFKSIEHDVADELKSYYAAKDADGNTLTVLYYFWVKVIDCPECSTSIDLFTSYIFAKHAYPRKYPLSHAVCPGCGEINQVNYDQEICCCSDCSREFGLKDGPASGQSACCPKCSIKFPIAKTFRGSNNPPNHRMYAKLVLAPDGSKKYLRITSDDLNLFELASKRLEEKTDPYPVVKIKPGYNTNQAIGYNYDHWHLFFNRRQLLCLSILIERIRKIENPGIRDLFICLFSGALEFNNMFTSYKGEGTGAVRHMFAHHILKPERTPLEANLWGTNKSSGSFSTMFRRRIMRALDYASNPFELRIREGAKSARGKTEKVSGIASPLGSKIAKSWKGFGDKAPMYVSCGDSSRTDIPDESVDAVITDPPFFDNVHYSELADFFHVWQRHIKSAGRTKGTTRSSREVQDSDSAKFTDKLADIWGECHRVLKEDGLLVFSYHHSRDEGWKAILEALMNSCFVITASQPIKAEMSIAMPKHQAKSPIDLDIVLVCRKRLRQGKEIPSSALLDTVRLDASRQVYRFSASNRNLSQNDVKVIVMGQVLKGLSCDFSTTEAIKHLDTIWEPIAQLISELYEGAIAAMEEGRV